MILAEDIEIILGKYESYDDIEILNSQDTLKLILDPNDILIPSKYYQLNISDATDSGYDVALIGLSKINKLKVD